MKQLSFLHEHRSSSPFSFSLIKFWPSSTWGSFSRRYAGSVELLDTFNAPTILPDVLFCADLRGVIMAMAFVPLMSKYHTTRGPQPPPGICFQQGGKPRLYRDWFHRHRHCHFRGTNRER